MWLLKHICKRDQISNDKGPIKGKINKTCFLSKVNDFFWKQTNKQTCLNNSL